MSLGYLETTEVDITASWAFQIVEVNLCTLITEVREAQITYSL